MTRSLRFAIPSLLLLAACAGSTAEPLEAIAFEEGKADRIYELDATGGLLGLSCSARPCEIGLRLEGDLYDPADAGVFVAVGVDDQEAVMLNEWLRTDPDSLVAASAEELLGMQTTVLSTDALREGVALTARLGDYGSNDLFLRAVSMDAAGSVEIRSRRSLEVDRAQELIPNASGAFDLTVPMPSGSDMWTFHVDDPLNLDSGPSFRIEASFVDRLRTEVHYVCDATNEVVSVYSQYTDHGLAFEAETDCDALDDGAQVYLRVSGDSEHYAYYVTGRAEE